MELLLRGVFFLLFGIILTTCDDKITMRIKNGLVLTGQFALPDTFTAEIGKRLYLEGYGLVLRGTTAGGPFIMKDSTLSAGGKLITENWRKPNLDEPVYQKSPDGSLWYTNVKLIGAEPMTRQEVNVFENGWPECANGRAARVEKGLRNVGKLSNEKGAGTAVADQKGTVKQQKKQGSPLAGLLSWFLPSLSWSFWGR